MQKDAVVAQHNFVRAYHGACPLQWSEDIVNAVKAMALPQWSNGCNTLVHTSNAARTNKAGFSILGENLVWQMSGYKADNWPVDLKTMQWYLEEYDYDYNTHSSKNGAPVGHFTQVVWKETTHIGCVMWQCPWQWGATVFMTCQYGPMGNIRGAYDANVGRRGETATGCTGCGGGAPPPAPPATWDAYQKKDGKSNGVIALMEMLAKDLQGDMTEAENEEKTSQRDYEKLMATSTKQRAGAVQSITNKEAAKADLDIKIEDTKELQRSQEAQLMNIEAYISKLHGSCDFLINNYDLRKAARSNEIDSLSNAKSVLSGADYA